MKSCTGCGTESIAADLIVCPNCGAGLDELGDPSPAPVAAPEPATPDASTED